ncbi:MAG: phage tail protein, partial [Lachnospiraceae bacterium]|nr:phage tail protein [Lachnospiraceae bacterium]MCM1240432.1 phage tail protein [Lachnospiraceae bacterium]
MEGTVITKKGIQLLAKAIAGKSALNITRTAVGTGKILSGYDPAGMTGLVEYKMDAVIAKCVANGDTAEIVTQLDSNGIQTGFLISEAGVYAEDPDEGEILYAYVDLSGDPQYMYPEGGQAIKFMEITLEIVIAEGTKVTAYINPSSLVIRQEFEEAVRGLEDHIKDKNNPHCVTKKTIGLGNVDDTADSDKPVSSAQRKAIDKCCEDAKQYVDEISEHANGNMNLHTGNMDNPHNVTKGQVGLGNVDDTADNDKPVSVAQQAALDELYQQMAAYTMQKIADLINGAPESMDTLKEVSDAIAANRTIMDALDAAIGKKASAAEFDSHTRDSTAHVTSTERAKWNGKADNTNMKGATASAAGTAGLAPAPAKGAQDSYLTGAGTWQSADDHTAAFTSVDVADAGATAWTAVTKLSSGETHRSIFNKISAMFKNVRYLYKRLGITDISKIGDGTVTGAISELNTGM